jgi:predicted glycoside hydrolase/deacetylase ChbG (UPF0249 family)
MVKGARERTSAAARWLAAERTSAAARWLAAERIRTPAVLGRAHRASWLSITPEPERELPWAVAALAHRGRPPARAVADETAQVERLILHGSQRDWLRYLHGVVELVDATDADQDADVQRARALASAVISNHHNLLLGLPGRGAQLSAADRGRLARLTIDYHEVKGLT